MAVLISNTETSSSYGTRFPLRFGSGIPYVSIGSAIVSQRAGRKGNATEPTSFSQIHAITNVPRRTYYNTIVMANATQVQFFEHYYSGMTQQLRRWTVNEAGTNNSGSDVVATLDGILSTLSENSDSAIDSNGAIHVIWNDYVANMGTSYITLYYANNVGGSWNTRVEIYGASNSVDFGWSSYPTIHIDINNIPIIGLVTSASTWTWQLGNANNATSFSGSSLGAGVTWYYPTMGSDIRGDHYVFGWGSSVLNIRKHESGDAWTTNTLTTINNKVFNDIFGVHIQGDYAYVFFKDNTNNATGGSIAKIDISGTTPTYVATIELTTHNWNSSGSSRLWKTSPLYHNYNKDGINIGISNDAKYLDFAFHVFDNPAYSFYWDAILVAPSIALNTADLTDFTDTTPTLEQTGDEQFDLDILEYDVQVMTDNLAVVDSYSESNYNVLYPINHLYWGYAQSFTGDGKYLTRATLYLNKFGSPTGYVRATLYAHSGTYGVSSLPTGSPLAISTTALDVSTLTGVATLINFDFDGSFQLVNGTYYVIAIEYDGGSATDGINVGHDSSSPAHSGINSFKNTSNVWTSQPVDMCFYINGHTLLLDRKSDVDTSEFVNTVTGGDTHPFNDAEKIAFTIDGRLFESFFEGINTFSLNNSFDAASQSFAGIDGDLNIARFQLRKIGSPTGNTVAKLYAHTGTFGTGSEPTGTVLATSDVIDVSTIGSTAEIVEYTFSTPYTMSIGTNYCIVIEYTNGDASNYINVYRSSSNLYDGNASLYNGSSWVIQPNDINFELNASIELPLGTYYWRARARSGDLTGYWSAIRSFDIIVISSNVSKIKVTAWKDWVGGQINIGGTWKTVTAVKINIGGVWKDADITP